MRASIARLLLALLAFPALAAEDGASRPAGSGDAGRAVAKSAHVPPMEPEAAPLPRAPLGNLKPGGSCGASEFEVCLDRSGRIHVPGAKRFLPVVPGLKPEKLTVKRSGVVFSYSF